MIPNRDKLQFYTGDPIDKIVAPAVQQTIVNDGNTGGTTGWQTSKIVQQDYTNPYGKQCFVRGKWSIDGGTTWYTFEAHQIFTFTNNISGTAYTGTQTGQNLKAAVSIAVSATTVRIVTANGDHGNVTTNSDTNAQSYTPISHTFLIEYELFEIQ